MDFQPISSTCVKITLTADEAVELDISFESFEKDDVQTKAFLTYTLAIMSQKDLLSFDTESISVEVYEQQDKSLIIYIIGKPSKPIRPPTFIGFFVGNPSELFALCPHIQKTLDYRILSCELYEYLSEYILIISVSCARITAQKRLASFPASLTNSVAITKIREYGNLLSNSPFDLFI